MAEEDNKKTEAEKKKEKKLSQIKSLREQFHAVRLQDQQSNEFAKLSSDELCVDPEYIQMLNDRVAEDVEETRKELEYDQYYAQLMTDKLKKYVIDELQVDKFTVIGIKTPKIQVNTFKVKKLTEYVKE